MALALNRAPASRNTLVPRLARASTQKSLRTAVLCSRMTCGSGVSGGRSLPTPAAGQSTIVVATSCTSAHGDGVDRRAGQIGRSRFVGNEEIRIPLGQVHTVDAAAIRDRRGH